MCVAFVCMMFVYTCMWCMVFTAVSALCPLPCHSFVFTHTLCVCMCFYVLTSLLGTEKLDGRRLELDCGG